MNDGGPAFPCDSQKQFPTQGGMSLRDWFAGQALAGMGCQWDSFQKYLNDIGTSASPCDIRELMASSAYAQANAMMEEREKSPRNLDALVESYLKNKSALGREFILRVLSGYITAADVCELKKHTSVESEA